MRGGSGVFGIAGRRVLVTGAAGGIGRAVVEHFVAAGAEVCAADRVTSADWGSSVESVVADVTSAGEVTELFATVGGVDAVVHCAGIIRTGPVADLTDEDWSEVFAVNATGVMVVCRAAARAMAGPGSITVISSNAATTPRVNMAAYGASKAAATAFVRGLGLELADRGIRCNVISPGSTDTPMLRESWEGADRTDTTIAGDPARFRIGIPLGRLATSDDIAATAVFLASDAARHITLHDLRVDGGATLDS